MQSVAVSSALIPHLDELQKYDARINPKHVLWRSGMGQRWKNKKIKKLKQSKGW